MDLSRLAPSGSTRRFVELVSETCRQHGASAYFGRGAHVLYGGSLPCLGYFDEWYKGGPRYAVATGLPISKWLPIAVHEFSHLMQWIEGVPAWTDQSIAPSVCALDRLIEWTRGKELTGEELELLVRVAREVERDCEERTVKTITLHRLPIDPVRYAKQANAYIFYYTAMRKMRKLSVRSTRDAYSIWRRMPDKILPQGAYDELSDEDLRLYAKHVF